MRPIVIDASIVVEFLLRTQHGERLDAVLREPDADLHVLTADEGLRAAAREQTRVEVL